MVDPFDPEELLVCPYDPVHRVARKRMQTHLVKCRKNYNTKQYKTCPFNAQHVIPRPEFHFHIENCPYRGRVEAEMLHESSRYKQKGNTTVPSTDWTPPVASESWDDDNVVYVPERVQSLFEKNPVTLKSVQPHPPPEETTPTEDPIVRMPRSTQNTESMVYQYSVGTTVAGVKGRGRGRGAHVGMLGWGQGIVPSMVPSGLGRGLSGSVTMPPPGFNQFPSVPPHKLSEATYPQPNSTFSGAAPPMLDILPGATPPQINTTLSGAVPLISTTLPGAIPPQTNSTLMRTTPLIANTIANTFPEATPLIANTIANTFPEATPLMSSSLLGATPLQEDSLVPQEATSSDDETKELNKTARKLKKMLRQIEQIELKRKAGQNIEPEQVAKINRKEDVITQLQRVEDELELLERRRHVS